jgi:hypothetical protein
VSQHLRKTDIQAVVFADPLHSGNATNPERPTIRSGLMSDRALSASYAAWLCQIAFSKVRLQ